LDRVQQRILVWSGSGVWKGSAAESGMGRRCIWVRQGVAVEPVMGWWWSWIGGSSRVRDGVMEEFGRGAAAE